MTDDIELGRALRALGARTAHGSWLAGRLDRQRLVAPAAGRPKRAAVGRAGARVWPERRPGDGDAPRWKPGRGATKKTGNPKRGRAARRTAGRRGARGATGDPAPPARNGRAGVAPRGTLGARVLAHRVSRGGLP